MMMMDNDDPDRAMGNDVEFFNLGAEEQTIRIQAQAAAIVTQLEKIRSRLEYMGATARALDINEAIEYVNAAVEEV